MSAGEHGPDDRPAGPARGGTASSGLIPELERLVLETVEAAGLVGEARRRFETELRGHFEDGVAAGVDPAELAARFGDPDVAGRAVHEAVRAGRSARRNDASTRMTTMGEIATELRRAARGLLRSPGWALLVVVTLALGVGANIAVFTVLDAVLFEPLPYDEPERLVRVYERWTDGPPESRDYVRGMALRQHRAWDEVFDGVAAAYTYREEGADLAGDGAPERVVVSKVSAGFFEVLGVAPRLGRTFREEESWGPGEPSEIDEAPGAYVAVLSHGLWQRRFAGVRGVVGRTIRLDDVPYEVVGVVPESFRQPLGTPPDLWVPQEMRAGGRNSWNNFYLTGIARLADGVSFEEARARVRVLSERLRTAVPEADDVETVIDPLRADLVGEGRRSMLWILAGAVGLVLLSACVNVANLVLARSLGRERDIALRGALGSGRGRLVGHLLTESALLAVVGGLAGLALGTAAVRVLPALAPEALPVVSEPRLSLRVFGFALAVTVGALLAFGLAPALRLARLPPADALRSGGRGGTEGRSLRRVRDGLVVTQVALAVVLVVGAGLLVRSFAALREARLGVDPQGVLTFEVHLPHARYPDGSLRHEFVEGFHERLAGLPGVTSVSATSWLPASGRYHSWGMRTPAEEGAPVGDWRSVDVRVIAGDYFRTVGIERVRGPAPAEVDPAGKDIVWLNRAAARDVFGDADPVGRALVLAGTRRVVGVVADAAHDTRGETSPQAFILHAQYADNRNWALIHAVKVTGDADGTLTRVRTELAALDPALVLYRPASFDEKIAVGRAQDRFATTLMATFALLAATLAGVGTYGVLAGAVARRRREIGIRLALGAEPGRVRGMVLRSAAALLVAGLVLGTLGAWLGSRYLAGMLFEVPTTDPLAFTVGAGLLLALGLGAAWMPARRATRVDPAEALVAE